VLVAIGLTNCSRDGGSRDGGSRAADLAATAAPSDGGRRGDGSHGGDDGDGGNSGDDGDGSNSGDDACPAQMARVTLPDAGAVCVDRYGEHEQRLLRRSATR
jgi:hypothetical protein